jgi:hypothetical protein
MTENLIESIRAAVADGASPDARAAGANACRTLLTALEAPPALPPGPPSLPIAAIASALRTIPPDQLADLLIAKLRTLVPADAQQPPVCALNIQRVTVPAP